jgi:mono/diheme cytochrome c family protein
VVLAVLVFCSQQVPVAHGTAPSTGSTLEDRIARGLAELSPPAEPGDAGARDAAAKKLARFGALLDATGERILWGGFDPKKGYNPNAYTLTEFYPPVWVKLYLSTFMFPGEYQVVSDGDLRILVAQARFRADLDPGDYPYPFWHSAAKWRAYVDTEEVLLVFRKERIVAAFRKAAAAPAAAVADRPWDGHWRWTDEQGVEQPRAALYSYLFSAQNPRVAQLERTYRELEQQFRSQNCTTCHAPDNRSKAKPLLLLNYPNQALAARHSLVEILRDNEMPPADLEKGTEAGVHDAATLESLIALAEQFERAADEALAYEKKIGALRGRAR